MQMGGGMQDLQLSYFCGSSRLCSDPSSRAALQLAKHNIETRLEVWWHPRYTVVGVMEHWETSLRVLEAYLPRWFAGAAEVPVEHRSAGQSMPVHSPSNRNT